MMRIALILSAALLLLSLSFPEGWKSGPVPASGYDTHAFGDNRNWSVWPLQHGIAALSPGGYKDSILARVPWSIRSDTSGGYSWEGKCFAFKNGYLAWFRFGPPRGQLLRMDLNYSEWQDLELPWEDITPEPVLSWSWWWCDKKGKHIKPMLYDCNFNSMVTSGDTIYALNSTRKTDYGLYRLINKDTSWRIDTLYHFTEEPYLLQTDDQNKILIVTANKLLKYDPAKDQMGTLLNNNFWVWLNPNSMVFDKNDLYLGMQGGILKIGCAQPYPMEWFTKE